MCEIVGRKKETTCLKQLLESRQPEFIAIYGRRRVGKTFLVTRTYSDSIVFSHTGLAPVKGHKNTLKNQLQNFRFSLMRYGAEIDKDPSSWLEAFYYLEKFLETIDNGQKQVVFIDEMSWMDTPKSFFTTALESFWNGWGNRRNNLILVICSSATSWMLDNVINESGGLYNRITDHFHLKPFTLHECEDFFKARKIPMTRADVLKSYMILGGIPYYMNLFSASMSFHQNIDQLFYGKGAKLANEFDNLFRAVFGHAELSKKIVELLANQRNGLTRSEIARRLNIDNNGEFHRLIRAIVESGYIRECTTLSDGRKIEVLRLADQFCLFWLHFHEKYPAKDPHFWSANRNTPIVNTWQGYAFEDACFNHIPQIKNALGIAGITTEEGSSTIKDAVDQAQLDMIIWRSDGVINLCEMKFTGSEFEVSSDYEKKLEKRIQMLSQLFPKSACHLTLVCPSGLKINQHSGVFQSIITIEDLFQ